MKNLLLLIPFLFLAQIITAQNYQISFAGTGSSLTVDNVLVENLTQGTTTTLNGSDILHLTSTVGLQDLEKNTSGHLKVYPNPMLDECSIEFVTVHHNSKTSICLYDISGILITSAAGQLPAGYHIYRLRGIKKGIYILKVTSSGFTATSKLVCNNGTDGLAEIKYIAGNTVSAEDYKSSETDQKMFNKGSSSTTYMQYNTGDLLKFTGISGDYRTVLMIDAPVTGLISFIFTPCIDKDNNHYPVVFLGTQAWMAENLKTTKYENGDIIGTTTPASLNISSMATPKYQWAYAGNESNADVYGRLYTWFVVTDSRKLCPSGWHVPTDAEWTTLTDYLGGLSSAGGKIKETGTAHWFYPNTGASNKSGFTALPAGYRHQDGSFALMGSGGYFWTSETGTSATYGWSRYLQSGDGSVTRYGIQTKQLGLSVRCTKD